MKAMDVSDVFYDRFLINGKPETTAQQFKAGDKVALHVVNAGAIFLFLVRIWRQNNGNR